MDKIFSLTCGCFIVFLIVGISMRVNLNPVYAIVTVTSVAVISLCIYKFLQADNERNDFKLVMEQLIMNNKEIIKKEVDKALSEKEKRDEKENENEDINILLKIFSEDSDINESESLEILHFSANENSNHSNS